MTPELMIVKVINISALADFFNKREILLIVFKVAL
jgi:hypothetical protein